MATLGVVDTQPGASQCVFSYGGHPGWVCFGMSAEAAVAEVSVPCMEPILQMCMKGSEFFSPFFSPQRASVFSWGLFD